MALRINVGFTRKLGQPDFGSVGASCNIECELDSDLLFRDPGGFQKQVQGVYAACTQAVHDELARHQHGGQNGVWSGSTPSGTDPQTNSNSHASSNGNGQYHGHGAGNGNGNVHQSGQAGNGAQSNGGARSGGRSATQSQVRAIHAIANRQGLDLPAVLRERFGLYRADELSLVDASRLIDELKAATGNVTNGTGGGR